MRARLLVSGTMLAAACTESSDGQCDADNECPERRLCLDLDGAGANCWEICNKSSDCENQLGCIDDVCQPVNLSCNPARPNEGCPDGFYCNGTDSGCLKYPLGKSICRDTIKGPTEADVDYVCDECPPCSAGDDCIENGDCEGHICAAGARTEATCDDAALNGTDTDIDCDAACMPCGLGFSCEVNQDCTSGDCKDGQCNTCGDRVPRGPEECDDGNTAVDLCFYGDRSGACTVFGSSCPEVNGLPSFCGDRLVTNSEGGVCDGGYVRI